MTRLILDRRFFRNCVGCPCFLRGCADVLNVRDGQVIHVYDVCCKSCVSDCSFKKDLID